MKIIEMAPYAYIKGHREFDKTTGAAFAIIDIAEGLALNNEVLLLTQSAITKGFLYKGIKIVKKTWIDVFRGLHISNIIDGIKAGNGIDASIVYRMKVLLYFIAQGHAEKVLQIEKPDIAHIESIGFYTLPYIRACINCGIPFTITSHGLCSFLDEEEVDPKQRKMESDMFKIAEKRGIFISCVSSGMITRMKEAFGLSGENLRKIGNCVGTFEKTDESIEKRIKQTLKIGEDQKVVICLGSICSRKNQIQVARAYALLSTKKREKTKLLFIGSGPMEDEIRKYANDHNLKNVEFTGYIDHERLAPYYSIGDINITASKDEGFGLPIIEAYAYGVPTVAFSDIDAVDDLGFEHGLYLAHERTDECLSKALISALEQSDNYKEEIIKKSAMYTKSAIAKEYAEMFHDALDNQVSRLSTDDLRGMI